MEYFNFTANYSLKRYSSSCEVIADLVDLEMRKYPRNYFLIVCVTSIVINAVFAVIAMFGNALVIISIWRTPSLHSPSNVLICSLSVSDFLVGFVSQPCFVIRNTAQILGYFDTYCKTFVFHIISSALFATASLVTLTVMSVDRYLALRLHMRYNSVVTVRKIAAVVLGFWIVILTLILLLWFFLFSRGTLVAFLALDLPCLLICCWCYWKIFQIIRRHRRQIRRDQVHVISGTNSANHYPDMARYRRTANSLLYIIGALALCYLPFLVSMCLSILSEKENMTIAAATQISITVLLFLNSSLNPSIYFWRVTELRLAARKSLRDIKGYVVKYFS